MQNRSIIKTFLNILFIACVTYFAGCAALQEIANIKKPTAIVDRVRFTGMTFDAVDLAFDVKINNPNPIAATLAGFDFDFLIENKSFLTGNQTNQTTIASNGESVINIPVSIPFKQLFNTYKSISQQDSAGFQLKSGITVQLPVLGNTRIPISYSGKLPVLKLPKVDFAGINLKKLSLTRADLELKMNVDNPNTFGLNTKAYNFKLFINDANWANGAANDNIQVRQKSKQTIAIPISLNLFEMGRTAHDLVSGNRSLQYRFVGDMNVGTTIPMVGDVAIPFDRTGNVTITR
ncbi:LEA type 2 family protein [candidate division KSB1 bacterium]|nr:LEA type 2 family protein [candidate division KSB1 bacterium]